MNCEYARFAEIQKSREIEENKLDVESEDWEESSQAWTKPVDSVQLQVLERNLGLGKKSNLSSNLNEEHNRSIIHLDIDCFYAQVEMLRNPELCNKPLGIQQKNIIVTCNYVARQLGVNKCTFVTDAIKLCPQLILVSGEDLANYRQMSYQISEFIQKYSPHVERLGLDENFVDVSELVSWRLKDRNYKTEFFGHVYASNECEGESTDQTIDNAFQMTNINIETLKPRCDCGCELRLQIASQIAADIREALKKELGITSCAGIAHNKLLAKLVGAIHKPNQQTSVLPHMAVGLISSLLSVGQIPGIGLTTGNTLKKIGITTIKELQSVEKTLIVREFGPVKADFLIKCSQGIDESPVLKYGLPQTLSDEDSFKCCCEYKDAEDRIKNLLISLLKRLIEDGRVPQTVRLTIRRVTDSYKTWQSAGGYVYRKRESRQCPVPGMIFTGLQHTIQTCATDAMCERLMPVLMALFNKLVDTSKPFHLTLLSIGFANLVKCKNKGKGKISQLFKKSADSQTNKMVAESFKSVDCTNHDESGVKSKPKNSQRGNANSIIHFFKQSSVFHRGIATLPVKTSPVNDQLSRIVKKHKSTDALLPRENMQDQQVTQNKVEVTPTPNAGCGDPCTIFPYTCTDSLSDNVSDLKMIDKKSTENSYGSISYDSNNTVKSGKNFEITESNENINKTECQMEEKDSLQRLLPKDIDAKTVSELPYDLQKEILAQYGILAEGDDCCRRYTLISKTMTTRSHSTATFQFSPTTPSIKHVKRLRSRKRAEEIYGTENGSTMKVRKLSVTEVEQRQAVSSSVTGDTQEPSLPDRGSDVIQFSHTVTTHADVADSEKLENTVKQSKVNEDPTVHSVMSWTEISMKCPNSHSARFENKQQADSGQLPNSTAQSTIGSGPSPNGSQSLFNSGQSPTQCGLLPKGGGQSPKSNSSNAVASHSTISKIIFNEIDPTVFSALPKNIQSEILAHIAMESSPKPSDRKSDIVGVKTSKSSINKQKESKSCKNTLLNYFDKKGS